MSEFSGQPLQLLRHNIPSVVNNCFLVDLRKSDYVGDAPVVSRVLPYVSSKKAITLLVCIAICMQCMYSLRADASEYDIIAITFPHSTNSPT